jgi:hypothetical protein
MCMRVPAEVLGDGQHGQVGAGEVGVARLVAEDDPPDAGVQPVGADHEVEPTEPAVFEGHRTVGGDPGDPVAEYVLHVIAGGVVVDLAEVVAHDLDVAVGRRAEHLGEVDLDRSRRALPRHDQPVRAGGELLDAMENPHALGDLHRGAEQVDRMPAGLAWRGGALDHRHRKAVTAEPVGEDRTGDARA